MGVRFRLYGCERMRKERMIGESVVGFASLNLDLETTHWLTLEPRSNLGQGESKLDIASLTRSDSASSTQSMQHGGMPELLVGLAYNGTTGRLSVEVCLIRKDPTNAQNFYVQPASVNFTIYGIYSDALLCIFYTLFCVIHRL